MFTRIKGAKQVICRLRNGHNLNGALDIPLAGLNIQNALRTIEEAKDVGGSNIQRENESLAANYPARDKRDIANGRVCATGCDTTCTR